MRYLVRRATMFVLTLWAAVTLNFVIPRLMPGSPTDAALAKFAGVGTVTPAQRQAVGAMLGLPHGGLLSQYGSYLADLARFRFGVSYTYFPQPVSSVIGQALPWTLVLVGTATVIAFVAGTLLGVLAAWRRGRTLDAIATVGSAFSSAFPYFWTALLLLFAFGFTLGWFPIKGGYSPGAAPQASLSFVGDAAYHSVLPAITIIISVLGGWVLSMRNNMIPTLGEDYVTFAEANGLRRRTVALRYAARNALLPNMTLFALALGLVVSGSVLTEYVFGYPGVGYLLANAISNRDYPLLQALFLIITLSVLVANFLVDLLYTWLDPRVRR
jgi:peptide/nickel transport system permease protein